MAKTFKQEKTNKKSNSKQVMNAKANNRKPKHKKEWS